ncbi:MAG TPA: Mur ligase family protein, partial [Gammaproteobacteria bacterium]|nr:Mur ligase family protein [Gammaproteobacteria bacterium]
MSKYPIIFIAKLTSGLSRITRHGGTALPGLVAEKLNSNILSELAGNNFKQGIILITGTNGKTTTALLTTQILHDAGHTVLHNKGGSNLMRGIITTIIKSCNWRGQLPHEIAVFEVDENAFPAISAKLNPSHIVITNLFRDQLDRYGELDSTAEKLRQAIMKSKNAQ